MNVGPTHFAKILARLSQADEWTVDCETGGGDKLAVYPFRKGAFISGIAVRATGRSFYFPFRHSRGNLGDEHRAALVHEMSKRKKLRGFNLGFDLKFLHWTEKVKLPPAVEEVQTMAHLLNENEDNFKLKSLADKYLGKGASQQSQDLGLHLSSLGLGKGDMDQLPSWEVAPYACQDVDITDGLHDFYLPHLKDWKLHDLWLEENEYTQALYEMEMRGMLLDVDLVHKNMKEATIEAEKARKVLHELAGYAINPNSSKQLQAWLDMPSTAKDILEDMLDRPGVQELLDFRVWSKANANYYSKFLAHMDPWNVLHANFNRNGTKTSRLSASDPPMQAVPRYTNKYRIKDVIRARPGFVWWEADYSQAEIRVATHYGKEDNMRDKLARGADIHTETAQEIDIPRDDAKRLNFSVIYGIGPKKYAERQGIPVREARKMLDRYHSLYPGWRRLYNKAELIASQRGYIRLFTGRMRHFNSHIHAPTHKASSNLVQGTVGEMIRVAILKIRKHVPEAKMILQVHDSINGELPAEGHLKKLREVKKIMEDHPWCSVPPKVDIKVGDRWGTLKKVESFK